MLKDPVGKKFLCDFNGLSSEAGLTFHSICNFVCLRKLNSFIHSLSKKKNRKKSAKSLPEFSTLISSCRFVWASARADIAFVGSHGDVDTETSAGRG